VKEVVGKKKGIRRERETGREIRIVVYEKTTTTAFSSSLCLFLSISRSYSRKEDEVFG